MYRESKQLFADSDFQLTKWAPNDVEVYADIPEEQCAPTAKLLQEHNSQNTQGEMGLHWNPSTDVLTLDDKALKKVTLTKRCMLSVVHSFFDPLGFTATFLLRQKLVYIPAMFGCFSRPHLGCSIA